MREQKAKIKLAGHSEFEEFNFLFADEFDEKIDLLEDMRNRLVYVNYSPKLPENWKTLSPFERRSISLKSKFDLELKYVFFQNDCEAKKSDIEFLVQFPELQKLTVWGHELDLTDIEKFKIFKKLSSLVISGSQFGDEVIPFLLGFRRLRHLDVQVTSITDRGTKELQSKLLKRTRLWLP